MDFPDFPCLSFNALSFDLDRCIPPRNSPITYGLTVSEDDLLSNRERSFSTSNPPWTFHACPLMRFFA